MSEIRLLYKSFHIGKDVYSIVGRDEPEIRRYEISELKLNHNNLKVKAINPSREQDELEFEVVPTYDNERFVGFTTKSLMFIDLHVYFDLKDAREELKKMLTEAIIDTQKQKNKLETLLKSLES